jgi:phosphate starvation-inducible PhoH-like protein
MTNEFSEPFEPSKSSKKASRKAAAAMEGKMKALAPSYVPKTENQRMYLKHLTNSSVDIVLGVGPAGSGKTLFACYAAIQALIQGKIQKIIMTRPLVSVDKEDIGYLPGNMIRKMDPWTRPIFDILLEFYSQRDIDAMLESGVIEISPLAYMRGRTFKKAFIIADEMQNSSPNQMLMMMTRVGLGTKMVITGDLKQSDRPDWENGLKDFLHKWKGYSRKRGGDGSGGCDEIQCVEMEAQDIQRSAVVSKILDIYEEKAKVDLPARPSSITYTNSSIFYQMITKNNSTVMDDAAIIPKYLYRPL